jgi:hypothetical protein
VTSTSLTDAESKATAFLRQKHRGINEVFSDFETRHHQEVLGNIFDLGLQKHLEQKDRCDSKEKLTITSILRMRLAGKGCLEADKPPQPTVFDQSLCCSGGGALFVCIWCQNPKFRENSCNNCVALCKATGEVDKCVN